MAYARDELKRMASIVLSAKAAGDFRAFQLVMAISIKTGMSPNQIEANIHALAK